MAAQPKTSIPPPPDEAVPLGREDALALLNEAIGTAKRVQGRHTDAAGMTDYTDLGWVVGKLRKVRDALAAESSLEAVS